MSSTASAQPHPKQKSRCLVALAIAVSAAGCSASGEAAPSGDNKVVPLRIAQAWNGGDAPHLSAALMQALSRMVPNVEVEVFSSSAGITNLVMLRQRELEAAATYADTAYMASVGRLPGISGAFNELRAIAVLPTRELQILIAPGVPIESIADLRGKRVSLGPSGTGVAVTARLLLSAYGLGTDDIEAAALPFDSVQPLLERKVDVMFMGGLMPNPLIAKAITHGGRLLQVVGPELERFRAEYPFLRATVIPTDVYPLVEPVHTVGVDRIFVTRADLDERLAYQLTKAFLEAITAASGEVRMLRGFNVGRAAAAPLPLHPGAARYYRELELRR